MVLSPLQVSEPATGNINLADIVFNDELDVALGGLPGGTQLVDGLFRNDATYILVTRAQGKMRVFIGPKDGMERNSVDFVYNVGNISVIALDGMRIIIPSDASASPVIRRPEPMSEGSKYFSGQQTYRLERILG